MTQPSPMRVRLYGGRTVHAAHELAISGGAETACGYLLDVTAENHWLDDTADVTCRRCRRATAPEGTR